MEGRVSQVTVELKNDLAIVGTLHSIDQFLNLKLDDVRVADEQKHPHMVGLRREKATSDANRSLAAPSLTRTIASDVRTVPSRDGGRVGVASKRSFR